MIAVAALLLLSVATAADAFATTSITFRPARTSHANDGSMVKQNRKLRDHGGVQRCCCCDGDGSLAATGNKRSLYDSLDGVDDKIEEIEKRAAALNYGRMVDLKSATGVSTFLYRDPGKDTSSEAAVDKLAADEGNERAQVVSTHALLQNERRRISDEIRFSADRDPPLPLEYWIDRNYRLSKEKGTVEKIIRDGDLMNKVLLPLLEGGADTNLADLAKNAAFWMEAPDSSGDDDDNAGARSSETRRGLKDTLSASEFVAHLIEVIPENKWDEFRLGIDASFWGLTSPKHEPLLPNNYLYEDKNKVAIRVRARLGDGVARTYEPHEFTTLNIYKDWGHTFTVADALRGTRAEALRNAIRPNPTEVKVTSGKFEAYLYTMGDAPGDKSFAIVVAGDSSSGRTALCCQVPFESSLNYQVFYCALEANDFADNPCPHDVDQRWRGFLETIYGMCHDETFKRRVSGADFRLSPYRGRWAKELAGSVMRRVAKSTNSVASDWLEGGDRGKPRRLAIVFDEANVDFAKGMISSVGDFLRDFGHLANQSVCVIVAGNGLEVLEQEEERMGHHYMHSKSRFVVLPKSQHIE